MSWRRGVCERAATHEGVRLLWILLGSGRSPVCGAHVVGCAETLHLLRATRHRSRDSRQRSASCSRSRSPALVGTHRVPISPGVIMPDLSLGDPGADGGGSLPVPAEKSKSSSSNESGYARRSASCRALLYSRPSRFQSRSSDRRSVRLRWLMRWRRVLEVKLNIWSVS